MEWTRSAMHAQNGDQHLLHFMLLMADGRGMGGLQNMYIYLTFHNVQRHLETLEADAQHAIE